jgi:predicted nucleotidyltransferase
MTNYTELLKLLSDNGVEFIVIGGVAAIAHGSPRFTQDVDVVYRRSEGNLQRLATALATVAPYLRGAPPGLPFRFDADTIRAGLNFTLTTSLGSLDLLGEVAGIGTYDEVIGECEVRTIFGSPVRIISLNQLIRAKRAAGRPKDLEVLAELESLKAESRHDETP